jgi:hypothetical protein
LASSTSSTFSSISSSLASAHATPHTTSTTTPSSTEIEVPASTPPGEKEIREKAQIIVQNDLKTWQEKFAKAADQGSVDLDERISEITDRLVKSQAQGVGKALIVQLEETVKSSLQTLKSSVITIVKGSEESEASEDALNAATRKAGVAIKEKAQAVRTWKQSYDRETNSLVSKAAQDTFDILDHIRDLGLQEIGMRWAWTDGITHKDWAKYHKLKPKFDEWRLDVERVATDHTGLEKARKASEEVENAAMTIAEEAARELARLKETGRWKINAGDSSDDWNTKHMPAAAAVGVKKIKEKVSELSESIMLTSQETMESVASVASESVQSIASAASSIASSQVDNVQSVASSVSESVVGTSTGTAESVISAGSASASSLAEKASRSIIGTQQGSVENVASVAKESASSIVNQASSSIIGTSQGTVESLASVATESASSLSAKASSIVGKEPGIVKKASESVNSAASVVSESASMSDAASSSISSDSSKVSKAASKASSSLSSVTSSIASSLSEGMTDAFSSVNSEASSASSTASKKVWGGAMAQHVETRQIIFDDTVEDNEDETYSAKLQSIVNEAGDRYSDITNAVNEALHGPTTTKTIQVSQLAKDKYLSLLTAANSALNDPEQGTGESITSVAASRYSDAVSV